MILHVCCGHELLTQRLGILKAKMQSTLKESREINQAFFATINLYIGGSNSVDKLSSVTGQEHLHSHGRLKKNDSGSSSLRHRSLRRNPHRVFTPDPPDTVELKVEELGLYIKHNFSSFANLSFRLKQGFLTFLTSRSNFYRTKWPGSH